MAVKHFLINPYKGETDSETITAIHEEKSSILLGSDIQSNKSAKEKISQDDDLVHVHGRVVVKADMGYKNSYTFQNGQTIRLERDYNNFNRRETQPVNVIVISGEGIPKNAEVLVDHNSLHETNRINSYKNILEHEESDKVRYYSIPVEKCFAWRVGSNEWNPFAPFEFALRVFKPYDGLIAGIEPELLKDTLYVTTGELKGNIVKTLVASDYQVVFQGEDGREKYLIRFRPYGDEVQKREPEAIAILDELNAKYKKSQLMVGYSPTDAKSKNESDTNN